MFFKAEDLDRFAAGMHKITDRLGKATSTAAVVQNALDGAVAVANILANPYRRGAMRFLGVHPELREHWAAITHVALNHIYEAYEAGTEIKGASHHLRSLLFVRGMGKHKELDQR